MKKGTYIRLCPLEQVLAETTSVCPVCLRPISARRVRRGSQVFLEKTCPEHGFYSVLIWNGAPDYEDWGGAAAREGVVDGENCPTACGLCHNHRRETCCLLLEVTARCNLGCPVCYASAGTAGDDPTLEALSRWYDRVLERSGICNIQLSGGEPTVREDLAEIIRMGKAKGFPYLQLNTNGLRLGGAPGYAEGLKAAGLDCVFLQFDALEDTAYQVIRGRPLLREKLAAVDACARAGLGVVLVPTLVAGVNDGQIGDILRFAAARLPHVRGVHFQPMSRFGRYPEQGGERMTIPDVLRQIEVQTGGEMKTGDFKPGTTENPYCSFNGAYLLEPDGTLSPLKPRQGCCGGTRRETVAEAQRYVARQWGRDGGGDRALRTRTPQSLDEYLERSGQYTLAVSGMVFQDGWTLDVQRLRECYIHVMNDGENIRPFCACNLTGSGVGGQYRSTP